MDPVKVKTKCLTITVRHYCCIDECSDFLQTGGARTDMPYQPKLPINDDTVYDEARKDGWVLLKTSAHSNRPRGPEARSKFMPFAVRAGDKGHFANRYVAFCPDHAHLYQAYVKARDESAQQYRDARKSWWSALTKIIPASFMFQGWEPPESPFYADPEEE